MNVTVSQPYVLELASQSAQWCRRVSAHRQQVANATRRVSASICNVFGGVDSTQVTMVANPGT